MKPESAYHVERVDYGQVREQYAIFRGERQVGADTFATESEAWREIELLEAEQPVSRLGFATE